MPDQSEVNVCATGKNDRHANEDRIIKAQQEYSDTKREYDELRRKPNKTPEDKKRLDNLKKQLKHLKDKADYRGDTDHRNRNPNLR